MSLFFSIISPIRNEEDYISQCLQSIVDQDFDNTNYEVLVIDGMSTDRTREIVRKFQRQNNNIKLLDNPQKGRTTALNIGLKAAKGDIIVRIDGHAYFEKDYLHQCSIYLENFEADCVGGPIENIGKSFVGKAVSLAMSSLFGVGNARFRTSGREGYVDCLAFGAYRREVFEKIGYFDEEFTSSEDDEFNYRLRKFGSKIYFTPKIKSYYYPRSSLTKLWRQYFQYGFWKIRVLQKHFKMMQLRQFVPPLFTFSFLGSAFIGLIYKPALYVFIFIFFSYILSSLFFSLKISAKKGLKYFIILPLIFSILHFSFGLGFWWGTLRFAQHWKKMLEGSGSEMHHCCEKK